MARPTVWLIDAHVQIFRAYHAMPDLRAPDGTPTGAVRGYAGTLLKWLETWRPSHADAAFDFAQTSFRNELFAGYKAGRGDPPEDLEPQFALCEDVTRALGVPVLKHEGFEADDVIATLAPRLEAQGANVSIVTTDKDLGALVTERVRLFDPRTETHLGPAEIEAKLGVPPGLVADYLTLVGDAVDDIPVVPGVGAKSAAALLRHFGGLDAIPADVARWEGLSLRGAARIAEAIAANRETIALARSLVRMRDDVPIDTTLGGVAWGGPSQGEMDALCARIGSRTLAERIRGWSA